MSVEPSELTSEVWTKWQGYVINGVFQLGRYLGCSDHSGVFLTMSASRPSEVAIKLVPTTRPLAQSLLPRWRRASKLTHPHLLGLLEWGGCQLDGLPYLYAVMEYADQTLAQLLQHRALTDREAQEMLLPTLDALAFLHSRNLVQGQLKPANILAVGDQLKLASDTIRRVSESALSTNTPTVYDPPNAQHGNSSTADDIWALGVSLFEALTRRSPSGLGAGGNAVILPADFSPEFRDIVARCLSIRPEDRPSANEFIAWARGRSAGFEPAATVQPVTLVPPESRPPEPQSLTASAEVIAEAARLAPSVKHSQRPRALVAVMLGAVVILALAWAGLRVLKTHRTSLPPLSAVQVPAGSPSPPSGGAAHARAEVQVPVSAVPATIPGPSEAPTAPPALHEVIPDVPRSARQSIRGHIKVWVRVIVGRDGSVSSAVVVRAGSSRYFRQLAIEAAQEWTFPPVDTPSRRLMQVRFDFSRDGTMGHAVTLH